MLAPELTHAARFALTRLAGRPWLGFVAVAPACEPLLVGLELDWLREPYRVHGRKTLLAQPDWDVAQFERVTPELLCTLSPARDWVRGLLLAPPLARYRFGLHETERLLLKRWCGA